MSLMTNEVVIEREERSARGERNPPPPVRLDHSHLGKEIATRADYVLKIDQAKWALTRF